MTKIRNFVILTHGRTGSNLLSLSLLRMGVRVAGEVFNDDAQSREDAMVRAMAPYTVDMDGATFIRNMMSADGPVGFKLFFNQAQTGPAKSVWKYLINTKDIAIIHLVRRDLLASWVSHERADRTGVWIRSNQDAPAPAVEPFDVNRDDLSKFFDEVRTSQDWARKTFAQHPFLEITYEDDLCPQFEATLNKVVDFVGATELDKAEPAVTRITHGDPARLLANFEELAQYFKDGPYADYFWNRRQFLIGDTHPGFCSKPFDTLSIDTSGKLRVCCDDWLDKTIGDARAGDLMGQWNSPDAQAIRASILDGSYRYCNKAQCPDLVKKSLPKLQEVTKPQHRRWIDENASYIQDPPAHLAFGYDQTCNLKCPTCRDQFIVLKGAAFDQAEKIHDHVVEDLVPHAKTALITGQGDAFSSRLYRRFLRELDAEKTPDFKVFLMTNGLSFTPQMWNSMSKAHRAIDGVSLSIDAASPETYAINRGGSFEKLMRNLRFLAGLVEKGDLAFLEISFVVQANNYAEMPDFVALAKEVGCSTVLFMKLVFWPGTFPRSQWSDRAVHLPDHPKHQEFLTVLSHPLVQDPMVDLSNLTDLAGTVTPISDVAS